MTHCPGSGYRATVHWHREFLAKYPCPFCRRAYAVNTDGTIRKHKGLPPRADGGCPYVCDPECDFSCYQPKVSDSR